MTKAADSATNENFKFAAETFLKTAQGMKGYRETVSLDVDKACQALRESGENSSRMVEQMMGAMIRMEERHEKTSEMTIDRMEKLEVAQNETSNALVRMVTQIEGMVKCVDKAILESKEDKRHYYEQYEKTHEKIDNIDKRLTTVEAKSSVRWGQMGSIGAGVLAFLGGLALILFKDWGGK